ncbi:hypothetical protein LCGC14_1211220 [marine sediment metagenome]|uniref:Uncharacterized protein n=1 Tax=marine sediment metagenome TaxID=412755 RepID=A0A0F9LIB4_9ZZZZ
MPRVPLDSPRSVLKSATRKGKRLAKQAKHRTGVYRRMKEKAQKGK